MVDGLSVESILWAFPNTAFAGCAEIQHPGVLINRTERQILNPGKNGSQADARPVFGSDHQTADAAPAQTSCLCHRGIERHAAQGMPGMGSKTTFPQPTGNFI